MGRIRFVDGIEDMKWPDMAITIVLIACVAPFVHGADEITITGDWTIVRPVIRQDACGVDGAIAIVAGTFADVLDEAIGKRPKVVEAGQELQGPGGRLAARFHSATLGLKTTRTGTTAAGSARSAASIAPRPRSSESGPSGRM